MKLYNRGYQKIMGAAMKLMPSVEQELIEGPGSMADVPGLLKDKGLRKPLLVTGPRVSKTEFFQRLTQLLREAGIDAAVFDEVEPDPTTELVGRVMDRFREQECDCFIALGGGSNMDAAKAAAAGLVRPRKDLAKLGGVMKVRRKTPFMIAIPTTAGTGSECTVAAVITDSGTHRKFAINDPRLCPDAAVLDADLTADLPPQVVAATGMDALTHAIEAWLNKTYHKPDTEWLCMHAVHDILQYLPFVYQEQGGSPRARQKLLEASYKAGQAFTVACVGNVHAIAHTMGGLYHIPHGTANAALLPVVLEDYGEKVHSSLAMLCRHADLDRLLDLGGRKAIDFSDQEYAESFIRLIRKMNRDMQIPESFPQIREEDLDRMAGWAVKEANPLYPVPVIYGKKDVKRILRRIMG